MPLLWLEPSIIIRIWSGYPIKRQAGHEALNLTRPQSAHDYDDATTNLVTCHFLTLKTADILPKLCFQWRLFFELATSNFHTYLPPRGGALGKNHEGGDFAKRFCDARIVETQELTRLFHAYTVLRLTGTASSSGKLLTHLSPNLKDRGMFVSRVSTCTSSTRRPRNEVEGIDSYKTLIGKTSPRETMCKTRSTKHSMISLQQSAKLSMGLWFNFYHYWHSGIMLVDMIRTWCAWWQSCFTTSITPPLRVITRSSSVSVWVSWWAIILSLVLPRWSCEELFTKSYEGSRSSKHSFQKPRLPNNCPIRCPWSQYTIVVYQG